MVSDVETKRRELKRRWAPLAWTGLLVLTLAVACSPADQAGLATTSSIYTGADHYFDADASTLGEIEVEVRLHDRTLEMAPSLPQGRVTFVVVNEGETPHGFEIEGRGIEEAVHDVAPGEMALLAVALEPGTYSVYCPMADHEEEGMRRWLRVVH